VGNNGTGDIASFYDIDANVEILHVGGNNGTFPNVGVKTSTPNVDFTVNGAISASSIIYSASSNSNQWNSTYATVQTNSASWGTGGGGGSAYLPLSGGTLTGTLSVISGAPRSALSNSTLIFTNSSLPNNTSLLNKDNIVFNNGNNSATLTPNSLTIEDPPDNEGRKNSVSINYNGTNSYIQVVDNSNNLTTLGIDNLQFNTEAYGVTLQRNPTQSSGNITVYLPAEGGTLLTAGGSAGGGFQTLSFNESNARLTITPNGNTVSLSALSARGGSSIASGAYLPLSGGTLTGLLSTTNIISTSGGNSNQWNSTYSTVQTNSGSWNSVYSTVRANSATAFTRATIGITIDGSGQEITTGSKGFISVPYSCIINNNTIISDQTGSIVIDVKKAPFSNFPATTSICAAAKPTLASARKSTDSTLTGWDTVVASGDVFEFVVDSIALVTKATLTLGVTKT
jgi:hypothetical protein